MSPYGPDRPGSIREVAHRAYLFACDICGEAGAKPAYDEASIMFTAHLNNWHPGWDDEAPARTTPNPPGIA